MCSYRKGKNCVILVLIYIGTFCIRVGLDFYKKFMLPKRAKLSFIGVNNVAKLWPIL